MICKIEAGTGQIGSCAVALWQEWNAILEMVAICRIWQERLGEFCNVALRSMKAGLFRIDMRGLKRNGVKRQEWTSLVEQRSGEDRTCAVRQAWTILGRDC